MGENKIKGVYILIRDDDVCFFTEPWELERVHRPLLEARKPVNIAVIPLVDSRLNEHFVKGGMRELRYVPITLNQDLLEFIKQYNFEVLQHGLTHTAFSYRPLIHEFSVKEKSTIKRRAYLGMRILKRAFGKTPRFFVPPWDFLSREGYEVLSKLYYGVLLASMGYLTTRYRPIDHLIRSVPILELIPRNLPLNFMPYFIGSRLKRLNYSMVNGEFLIVEHSGLDLFVYPSKVVDIVLDRIIKCAYKRCIITILVHYWALLQDTKVLDLWHKLVDSLLALSKVHFINALELYKMLLE